MPDNVSVLDGLGLVLVVVYAVSGLMKGAIRFIIGLAAVVVGIVLAGTFGESLGARNWPGVSGQEKEAEIGVLLGCALIFAATLLVGALVARLLRRAAEETDLGGVDRTLGLLFGGLRGLIYAELIVLAIMILLMLFPDMKSLRNQVEGSFALAATQKTAEICHPWFPPPTAEWLAATLQLPPERKGRARDDAPGEDGVRRPWERAGDRGDTGRR